MRSANRLGVRKHKHRVALLPHIKCLRTVAGYDLDAGTLILSHSTSGVNGMLQPVMRFLPVVNVHITFAGDMDVRTRLAPIAWLSVSELARLIERKAVRTGRNVTLANALRRLARNNVTVNAVFIVKNDTIRRVTVTKAEEDQTLIVEKVFYANGVAVFFA